jgi:hypothetical protein
MSMTRFRWTALAVMLTLWLVGCGGTDKPEPAAATAVPAGQNAQQVIGSAGGEVVLASTDGASFTLTVPAGALGASTAIALGTADATPAQHFNLRLTPAGTVFAGGKAATLTIALPPSASLPDKGGLLYDGVPVAFTRLADGRLQIQLTHFAGTPTAVASAARTRALRVRALADPMGGLCDPRLGGEDGSLVGNDALEIELYGQCMLATVNALAVNAQYATAVRVASVVAAYLQASGLGDPAGYIAQASSIACVAYRDALSSAMVAHVTTMGTLYDTIKPILFWEAVHQRLGGTCAGIGDTDYVNVVAAKTAEAQAFYASLKGSYISVDSVEYTEAAQEAKDGHEAAAEVRSLQPPQAELDVVGTQIEQQAQPGLLDSMLQPPWDACHDHGDRTALLDLFVSMDGAQPLKDALQFCATAIDAQSKDATGTVEDTVTPSLGGVSAGMQRTAATLKVARGGSVTLSGAVGLLACPGADAEQLKVTFEGVEVASLDGSATALLDANHALGALDVNALAAAAHLADDDDGTHPLTILRTGSDCAVQLGITDEVLATVTLDFGAPPLTVEVVSAFSRSSLGDQGSGGCNGASNVVVDATNLAVPFQFQATPCDNHTMGMTLVLSDPSTIVVSEDYMSSSTGALDDLLFKVTFSRAGTVTFTLSPTWITSVQCDVPRDTVGLVFGYAMAPDRTIFDPDLVTTLPACMVFVGPGHPNTQSIAVTAGQVILFEVQPNNNNGSMTGTGVMATVRFVAGP